MDATEPRASGELAASLLEQLPLSAAAEPDVSDTDATRVLPKHSEQSVHEEKTVVGDVPREVLEAEKKFSQRTLPPPAEAPEQPLDKTGAATPVAIRASRPSLPPQPGAEVKTLLSRTEAAPATSSWRWWALGLALLLLLLLLSLSLKRP